jgi:hypothetical protein
MRMSVLHRCRLYAFLAHAAAAAALATPAKAVAVAGAKAARAQVISGFDAEKHPAARRFVRPLARLGEWVRLADGRPAWRPGSVDESWRPYRSGSWAWTEAGWYWVSDEPWAWATYHFGRWSLDSRLGWIWSPGDEWAPSWVVWRRGPGVVGWAPRSEDGVVLPAHWTFVPANAVEGVQVPAAAIHDARLPALLLASRSGERGRAPEPIARGAPPVTARRAAR